MSRCCITFTPGQSAAAACVLDGLNGMQTAAALGISHKAALRRVEHLRTKLSARDTKALKRLLREIARPVCIGESKA